MACIQAQALAKEIRKYFLRLKFQLILMAFCFVAVTFYGSYQQQHKDIIYMRESISKFYKDFDSSVFTNASTIKEFLDQMSKFSVPFVNLDEIRKSADKVGHQIEILQSYEHDKTGRVDLALENSGGRIAKIGANTEMFYSCNLFWKLIGCPNKINGPEKLIQPQMHYGECFRFKGKEGSVTIRLVRGALLDAVTVEHLSKKMSPTGEVSAAPRKFSVSGLNKYKEHPFLFGNFTFNANKTSIQMFGFPKRAPVAHKYVQIDFHENNGNVKETNVYRIRVHGVVINDKITQ